MTKETDAVLKYLTDTNRPYSATDITNNLHKEFGKSAIQKALDALVDSGKVKEKVYGKQKVYCVVQSSSSNSQGLDNQLKDLDMEIETLSGNLKTVEQELKASESQFRNLESSMTTEEAKSKLNEVDSKVDNLKKKLEGLSTNRVQISAKDRDAVKKNLDASVKEYKKRKRMCLDILNSILESYPKTKKQLFDEVGIETDEDAGMEPLA